MQLSDAIRFGAMLKPQCAGHCQDPAHHPASCALGAALDAVGVPVEEQNDYPDAELRRLFPVTEIVAWCPSCEIRLHQPLQFIIVHLNDAHDWTREQIADFVQTIEESSSAPAVREDVAAPIVSLRD